LDVLKVWQGGMSFYGGLSAPWSRPGCSGGRHQLGSSVTDFLAPLVPSGLLARRFGNS